VFNITGGTFSTTGTNTKIINPGVNQFNSVNFGGTGSISIAGSTGLDINGINFNLQTGTTLNLGNLDHYIASFNIVLNGTLNASNANLYFDRGGNQNIPSITVRDVYFSTSGTKSITGILTARNLTIEPGVTLNSLGNNFNISGNWSNSGSFISGGNRVTFNGSVSPVSINNNNSSFFDVYFTPTTSVTYNLTSPLTRFIGGDLYIGSNAVLNVVSQTLVIGRNTASSKQLLIDGVLNIGSSGYLTVNNQGSQTVINVNGTLNVVGSVSNPATINSEFGTAGANETAINVNSGATIAAENYVISTLGHQGLVVNPGANVHNVHNFSNGTFTGMNTSGTQQRYYLVLNTDNIPNPIISNITFNYSSSPVIGQHFNIRRDAFNTVVVQIQNPLSGVLGVFQYEYDGATYPTPSLNSGLLIWPTPTLLTWVGSVSSDWHNPNNWNPVLVPNSNFDVIIPIGSPNNPIISNDHASTKNLTITTGNLTLTNHKKLTITGNIVIGNLANTGTLTCTSSADTITVSGNWTRGTNGVFICGSSTVKFNSSNGTVSITPNVSAFNNVIFDNSSSSFNLIGSTINVNNHFTIKAGNVNPITNNYTLNIGGNLDGSGGNFTTSTNGKVVLNGGNQSIKKFNFRNLEVLGSGIKTFYDTLNVIGTTLISSNLTSSSNGFINMQGNVTINTGGVFDDGGNVHHFRGSVWNGLGNYQGIGKIEFRGNVVQSISEGKFFNLALHTNNAPVNFNGSVIVNGDLYISSTVGQVNLNSSSTVQNNNGIGTFTLESGRVLNVLGMDNFPKNFDIYDLKPTSTVVYAGLMNQIIYGGIGYGNLTLNNANVKTLGGSIEIAGNLIFNNSTLDVSPNNYTIQIGGTWTNTNTSASFIPREGSVTFFGTTSTNLNLGSNSNNPFYTLVLNKAVSNTLLRTGSANLVVHHDLIISSGQFNMNFGNVFIGGNLDIQNDGSLVNTANVTMNSNDDAYIRSNNAQINNLYIKLKPTSNLDLLDNITVLNDFVIDSGIVKMNGFSISQGNNGGTDLFTISGKLIAGNGGKLLLSGSTNLVVTQNGEINLVGSNVNPVIVTNNSFGGRYGFTVSGLIHSKYTLYQFMNNQGIVIGSTGVVDTLNNFSNSTFTNGVTNGRYIQFNNSQKLTGKYKIKDVSFPFVLTGTSYNVTKINSADTIEFYNATGSFAGQAFELDPNNLIIWTGPLTLTWNGSIDNDWFKSGNWTPSYGPNIIPDSTTNVIIPSITLVPTQPRIEDKPNHPAKALNVTLNSGSILTLLTTTHAVDLKIYGDILIDGQLITSSDNDIIEFAGNWTKTPLGTVNLNYGTVVSIASQPVTVNNGNGIFNKFVSNSTSVLSLASHSIFNGDLVINSGSFIANNNNITLRKGLTILGNFTASTTQNVIFNSLTSYTYNILLNNTVFSNVTFAAGGSGIYNFNSNFTVNGNLSILSSLAKVNLNSPIVTVLGSVSVSGNLALSPSTNLRMGNGSSITVNSGGEMNLVGTSRNNSPLISNNGIGSYSITFNPGSTISAKYYRIHNLSASGLYIKDGVTINPINNLAYGEFTTGSNGGVYLHIQTDLPSNFVVDSVIFNSGPTYNVRRTSGINPIIFKNPSGILGSYIYEDEGTGIPDTNNLITWRPASNVWLGAVSSNWHDPNNWSFNAVPSSVDNVLIPLRPFNPVISVSDAQAYSIIITGGATLTVNNNKNLIVTNDFNNTSSFVIPDGSVSILSVGGTYTNVGTCLFGNQSTLQLNALSGVRPFVPGTSSLNHLVVAGGATHQLSVSNLNVLGNFVLNGGNFSITNNSRILTVNGNFTVNSGVFNPGLATVIISRSFGVQTITSTTTLNLGNLVLSGGSQKNLNANIVVWNIENTTASKLNAGNKTITVTGNWNNKGQFIKGTSTVVFNLLSGTQTINGLSSNIEFYNMTKSGTGILQLLTNVSISEGGTFTTLGGTINLNGKQFVMRSTNLGDSRMGISSPTTFIGAANFIYERYFRPHRATRYIASPIVGATVQMIKDSVRIIGPQAGGFDSPYVSVSALRYYAETGPGSVNTAWKSVPNTSYVLGNKLGYSIVIGGRRTAPLNAITPVTVRLRGAPFIGTLNYGITYTPSAGQGWNLIANPYICQIDWKSSGWTKVNVDPSIAVWDAKIGTNGNYYYYNSLTDVSSPPTIINPSIIPSGSSFFVKATGPSPTLIITENAKASVVPDYRLRKPIPDDLISLKLSDDSNEDYLVLHHWNNASHGYDPSFDTEKFFGSSLALFCKAAEKDLSINAFNINADTIDIPIHITVKKAGRYTLTVTNYTHYNRKLYLYDMYVNNYYEIEEGLTYDFIVEQNQLINNRFRLRSFTDQLVNRNNDDVKISYVSVYPNPVVRNMPLRIDFRNVQESSYSYELYDNAGRIIESKWNLSINKNTIDNITDLLSGEYLLKLYLGSKVYDFKVVKMK